MAWGALLVSLLLAGRVGAEEKALQVGLINTMNAEDLMRVWKPLILDMAKGIGAPVTATCFGDYAGVIWAMDAGKIEVAFLGNKSAIEAVDRAGGEVALRKVGLDGTDGYYSHLITRTDGGLSSLADVFSRGHELTFGSGDPNSTSGYVVPNYYLFASEGADPKLVFKRVTQASHQENLFAVFDGTVDVATSNSLALQRFRRQYPEKFAQIKVLWTSPLIPSDPVVWKKALAEPLKAAVRDFLLNYGRPRVGKSPECLAHEIAVLRDLTISGFIVSNDRQLLPIRELELFGLRSRIQGDRSLAQEQRSARLQEIESRLGAIREERIRPDY